MAATVQRASPDHAQAIVAVMRSGFIDHLLPYTIFGCHGIAEYLCDVLSVQEYSSSQYFVCVEGNRVLAFAELRYTPTSLFLNHIYVLAEARGRGIGSELLRYALQQMMTGGQDTLELDVFTSNTRAVEWYTSLGLAPVYEQVWLEAGIRPPANGAEGWWCAPDLAQANRLHEIYGFSQFSLQTSSASYITGRLGAHAFRSTNILLLNDEIATRALFTLDRDRKMLYILRSDCLTPGLDGFKVLASSMRLQGQIDSVRARLA